jgi:uncharacterized membrane protein
VLNYLPPLNEHNLPYPDTIHPIVVHFVIAMVLFAILCDVIGFFTKNSRLYEVAWWNLAFATVSIFIAVIFGQIEAGLAEPYTASVRTLNLHTLLGWSLCLSWRSPTWAPCWSGSMGCIPFPWLMPLRQEDYRES